MVPFLQDCLQHFPDAFSKAEHQQSPIKDSVNGRAEGQQPLVTDSVNERAKRKQPSVIDSVNERKRERFLARKEKRCSAGISLF